MRETPPSEAAAWPARYARSMELVVRALGTGPRIAVLVHGIMSDSRAWHRVAAELAAGGYRVLMPDLAGHGASPRARRYSPQAWADDLAETLLPLLAGARPALLLGHSLGGLASALAADRLRPELAVYADPALAFPRGVRGLLLKAVFLCSPRPSGRTLRGLNPRWSEQDIDIELATLRDWDRRTLLGFARSRRLAPPPGPPVAPSLVLLAERSLLVDARAAERLRAAGYTVRSLPGTAHTLFRDDHAGFMRALDDWRDEPR